jgi:hypothetical protein
VYDFKDAQMILRTIQALEEEIVHSIQRELDKNNPICKQYRGAVESELKLLKYQLAFPKYQKRRPEEGDNSFQLLLRVQSKYEKQKLTPIDWSSRNLSF